jgi:hypothetical protein
MLSKSATFQLNTNGATRNIMVTPLFLQNHNEPWQPNEIYEVLEVNITDATAEPITLGKIVVDDHMDWHYEGQHKLTENEIEQVARFVLSQV